MLWLREMRPFRRDPRFHELTVRLGMLRHWQRHGPPDGYELRDGRLIVP